MGYCIALISGILSALPLIWQNLYLLSWISMVPLFCLLLSGKPKYTYALLWGIGYYGVLYHWFTELYPMDFAGMTPLAGAATVAVAWTGLTALQALEIALIAPLYRLLHRKDPAAHLGRAALLRPLTLAALWMILEWLQTQTWMGVPYFRLALSQTGCLPMIQSASLFGSLGLSGLIVLVNAVLALGYLRFREDAPTPFFLRQEKDARPSSPVFRIHAPRYSTSLSKQSEGNRKEKRIRLSPQTRKMLSVHICTVIASVLFIFNTVYGICAIALQRGGETIRVALIQGNISSTEKWSGSLQDTFRRYMDLSEAAAESNPDIILWPESVINTNLRNCTEFQESLIQFASEHNTTVIVGSFDESYTADGTRSYNALFAFYPDGSVSDPPYYKRHLVPFGEYLPMKNLIRTLIPPLAELNQFSSDFSEGTNTNLLDSPTGTIGALICFDSIYETLALDSVRAGAQLLAISTNDSWYGTSAAVYQHLHHAMLRAVENGRYVIRAGNTGISAIIDDCGEVKEFLEPETDGYLCGNIALRNNKTLYTKIGNTPVLLAAFWCIGMAVLRISESLAARHAVEKQYPDEDPRI